MSLAIEVLDLSDHHAYRDFYQVYRRAQVPQLSHPWAEHELNVELIGNEFLHHIPIVAREGEEIVGVALLSCPLRDNVTTGYVQVYVPVERRREGIGTRLLQYLEQFCREDGRTQILSETIRRVEDETSVGREFFISHGFEFDTVNIQNELMLPVLGREVAVQEDYELLSWRGLPPNDLIDAYAQLRSLLNQEIPVGETRLDNEYWDASRIRTEEDAWHRQQRTSVTAVAIDSSGTLVGHTQLVVPTGGDTVFQWDTLVVPGHRGQGLGLSLKQRALHEADELLDSFRRIVTWNDASNEHMLRVNEALGYQQVAWLDQWVKHLDA